MAFQTHPRFHTPPDETVLWRYLDLPKFLYLLERRTLWFSRFDLLEDPREGAFTDRERTSSNADIEFMNRTASFVSCWRGGSEESMAMWDIYGKSGPTVAIKSTVGHLKQCIADDTRPVYLADVQYVDFSQTPELGNVLAMCVRKALSYRHESEVRMVMWDPGLVDAASTAGPVRATDCEVRRRVPMGFDVPVKLESLITAVIVGPREPRWIRSLVVDVAKRYLLDKTITFSDLLEPLAW